MGRKKTFGVRLDDASIAKLQRLAEETDRSMGSVVRTLLRLAEVGHIPEVQLPAIYTRREDNGQEVSRG